MGPMIIDNDGRTAGYIDNRNDQFKIAGSNLYLSGVHRIRLQVGALSGNTYIQFYGIIGENPKYPTYMDNITRTPCACGWGAHHVYHQGQVFPRQTGAPIRSWEIIELVLDCVNHKISYCIIHKNSKSSVEHIVVDTELCPFPWKWYLHLYGKMWCVRLL